MEERRLERRLKTEVERRKGKALKFTSPGWAGAQDRLVLAPGGRAVFVEIKAPGKKLRPLQAKRAAELEELGFEVWAISSFAGLNEFLTEVFGA